MKEEMKKLQALKLQAVVNFAMMAPQGSTCEASNKFHLERHIRMIEKPCLHNLLYAIEGTCM